MHLAPESKPISGLIFYLNLEMSFYPKKKKMNFINHRQMQKVMKVRKIRELGAKLNDLSLEN